MIIGIHEEISNHLNRFRMLNVDMLFLAHGLHEILMDQLPNLSPGLAIVHDQKMISLRD